MSPSRFPVVVLLGFFLLGFFLFGLFFLLLGLCSSDSLRRLRLLSLCGQQAHGGFVAAVEFRSIGLTRFQCSFSLGCGAPSFRVGQQTPHRNIAR